nr:type II toxin-antitoxin system HicA family toxin [Desulfovibrio desulfuricans]
MKRLKELGCTIEEGAKHTKVTAPDGRFSWVPRHAKDISVGTLANIERNTGIKLR